MSPVVRATGRIPDGKRASVTILELGSKITQARRALLIPSTVNEKTSGIDSIISAPGQHI